MPDIYDLADQHRAELLRREQAAAGAMVRAYGLAWQRIERDLNALSRQIEDTRSRGEEISPAWLLRRDRLTELQRQTEIAVDQFAASVDHTIQQEQTRAIEAGRRHAGQLMQAAAGGGAELVGNFAQVPTGALTTMVGMLGNGSPLRSLLDQFGLAASQAVGDALIEGLAIGQNPRMIARRIRDALDGNMVRALTIARTETLRAYREATRQTYAANSRVVKGWIWHCALDRRSCALCVAMHGKRFDVQERFGTHPNCFPAGTVASGPRAVGSTERWYEGDLVEIETARGHRLSVTPNHPVLTAKGWVAAGFLQEGDDVVSSIGSQGPIPGIDPDDYQVPALIEEVARSVGGSTPMRAVGMPTAPEDFHGDGIGSKVHVVRTNGLLRRTLNPSLFQPPLEQFLGRGYPQPPLFSGLRCFASFFDRLDSASNGGMGCLRQPSVVLRAASLGHQPVCLDRASAGNPRFAESNSDDVARHSVLFSQSLFGLSRQIPGGDFRHGQGDVGTSSSARAFTRQQVASGLVTPQTPVLDSLAESLLTNVKSSRGVLAAFAGDVGLDRILKISRRSFRGHVYNLETTEGWYHANGIVVHNCRCAMIPETRTWDELGFRGIAETSVQVEAGADWFARQSVDLQREILGPTKLVAYQGGAIRLEDLVGVRQDPRWGITRHQLSLRQLLGPAETNRWRVAAGLPPQHPV